MALKKPITDPASRIESMVEYQERKFKAIFLQLVALIKESSVLEEIADLLEAGQLETALDRVESAALLLGNYYGESLAYAARETAVWLSTNALTVVVSFDGANPRAVAAIQANRLALINGFTAEQRTATRQAITRGIEQGLNPREQARLFRDSIGLTAKQERAVANYRRLLESAGTGNDLSGEALTRQLRDRRHDRTVQRAKREKKPLTKAQIDLMVDRYRQRYLTYRSEVIARTEALRSVHEGVIEMYMQAFDSGALDPLECKHEWIATHDDRVRDSHEHLDGDMKPIGEPFQGLNGLLRFPGDPLAPASETVQCRCTLATHMDGGDD